MSNSPMYGVRITFRADRPLTNEEITQLLARLELEVNEPQFFDDSDPTNLSTIDDADYSTTDVNVSFESSLVPVEERFQGIIPASEPTFVS